MRHTFLLPLALALLLTACRPAPAEEEPTPTTEPPDMTQRDVAALYVDFLDGRVSCLEKDGSSAWFADLCWEREGARAEAIQGLTVRDLTGDGLPELCAAPHSLNVGGGHIWTAREGRVELLDSLNAFYESLLPNGGIFYHRPGAAPSHDDYAYRWLSPESQDLPECTFSAYDEDEDGAPERFYRDGEEVTEKVWQEQAAPYLALQEIEPAQDQQAVPFMDWLDGLNMQHPVDAGE